MQWLLNYWQRILLVVVAVIVGSSFSTSVYALEAGDYSGQDIYFYSKQAACTESATNSSDNLIGSSNIEKIYNYMISKGLTDFQAAGVVGNIAIESQGGDPTLVQISYQKEFGATHTNDPTPMGTKVGSGRAWGIIQWDAGGRAVEYAKKAGITGPIYELSTQLDLVWWHMTTETPTSKQNFIEEYKKTEDVEEATDLYEVKMEGARKPAMEERRQAAKNALKKYGSGTTGTVDAEDPVEATTNIEVISSDDGCDSSNTPSLGNTAETIVAIAQAELAKNVKQWDKNTLKYTDGHRWPWCASFVSWVYKEAGAPFTGGISGGWLVPAVVNMKAWFEKNGTYFKVGEQDPQPGDVAVFLDGYSHVNIVEKYEDGKVTTIGGNQSDQVTRYPTWKVSTHPMGLVGFGRLK
jgi:hypothetical protein